MSDRTIELAEAAGGHTTPGPTRSPFPVKGEPLALAAPSTIMLPGLGRALTARRSLPIAGTAETEAGSGVALVRCRRRPAATGSRVCARGSAGRGSRPAEPSRSRSPTPVSRPPSPRRGSPAPIGCPSSGRRRTDRRRAASPPWPARDRGRAGRAGAAARPTSSHPRDRAGRFVDAGRLRRVEHLQRLLLAGRLDGARAARRELAAVAADDPFAGCSRGYVLLRIGSSTGSRSRNGVVSAAPRLSDAYILRGEYDAPRSRAGSRSARPGFRRGGQCGDPGVRRGPDRLSKASGRAGSTIHEAPSSGTSSSSTPAA